MPTDTSPRSDSAIIACGRKLPLIIADVTRGSGHFNLAQGVVGSGVGIGASLSMTLAGFGSDHYGYTATFLALSGLAAGGFLLALKLLPETKP